MVRGRGYSAPDGKVLQRLVPDVESSAKGWRLLGAARYAYDPLPSVRGCRRSPLWLSSMKDVRLSRAVAF